MRAIYKIIIIHGVYYPEPKYQECHLAVHVCTCMVPVPMTGTHDGQEACKYSRVSNCSSWLWSQILIKPMETNCLFVNLFLNKLIRIFVLSLFFPFTLLLIQLNNRLRHFLLVHKYFDILCWVRFYHFWFVFVTVFM